MSTDQDRDLAAETELAARPSTDSRGPVFPRGPVLAAAAAGLVGVALLGAMIPVDITVVFAVVVLVLLLPLLNTRPVTWIILTIALVWLSRVITLGGVAPRFLDFVDFPLAVMSFVSAALNGLARGGRVSASGRAISKALLVVTAVVVASWAFSSPSEPQRLVAGWVLTFEPFLVLLAILIAPMTRREWKRLSRALMVLLAVQLPFSLGLIALGYTGDAVKGTLLGTGAGHHVSAGGIAVGFFLLIGLRARRWTWLVFGALGLVVLVVADAKQVLYLVPAALIVFGFSMREKGSITSTVRNLGVSLVTAAIVVVAITSYTASSQALRYIDLSVDNSGGKVALPPAIWHDISARPDTLVFGLGPGESVSRFAFLTTPAYRRTGNPAAYLNLHGSNGPQHYTDVIKGGAYTGESSFTSAQSSAFGILGDYGIVGVVAFVLLVGTVLHRLRRVSPERRPLAAAALASWTLLLPLAVVFDWLEQPPFTLAVMIVTGLALREEKTLDPDPKEQQSTPPDTAIDAQPTRTHP